MSSPFIPLLQIWGEYNTLATLSIRDAYTKRAIRFNLNALNGTGLRDNLTPLARRNMAYRGIAFRDALRNRDLRVAIASMHALLAQGYSSRGHLTDVIRERFDDVATCDACEQINEEDALVGTWDGGAQVCYDCRHDPDQCRHSNVMGGFVIDNNDIARFYPDADAYQHGEPDWVNRSWAQMNDYPRRDGMYFDNQDVIDEIFDDTFMLRDYHSGYEVEHIPSAYDKRKPRVLLGLELEVEVYDGEDSEESDSSENAEVAKGIMRGMWDTQKGYCKVERDGSLDSGFEIITGYTGLDVHEKVLKNFKRLPGFTNLRSHDTSTCGLHVHVDRIGMTPLHAAKLQQFIHSPLNERLIRTIARRYGTDQYARFHNGTDWLRSVAVKTSNRIKFEGGGTRRALTDDVTDRRYDALNWNNARTVEFRFFRGSTRFETIMACLEFAFCAWHFTKQTPHSKLSTEDFLAWIVKPENRADSKYLRVYLRAKAFRQFVQVESAFRPKDKALAKEVIFASSDATIHSLESDPPVRLSQFTLSADELTAIRTNARAAAERRVLARSQRTAVTS